MAIKDKQLILVQLAEIFGALQNFQLPDTVKGYGGLGFSDDGTIVSVPMTLIDAGPFQTYEALCAGFFLAQLSIADQSTILKGWRGNGVRERLELFLKEGLPGVVRQIDTDRKVLVHGDLSKC